jgi:long-chain fatty acid transport protein
MLVLFLVAFALVVSSAINPAQASSPANSGLVASADGAETAYLNPAGMVRLDRSAKTVQGIVGYSLSEFDVNEGQTSVSGGDPDSDHTPIVIPAFYYVKPFMQDWRFGFSINVPSGFGSNYGRDWAGRYYSDNFTLVYVGLTPSIAYRIDEHWSIGARFNLTYSYSKSDVRVNNPDLITDGKLEYEADSIGVTGSLALLYQFNDRTRIGLVYTGETSSDLEGDLEFSGLGPLLTGTVGNLDGKELEVENILPQRVVAGLYHEFESGSYVTLDGLWIDFSEFGTGDVSVEGDKVFSPEGIYNDLWAITLGFGFPKDDRTTWKVGMMYLSQAIDDDKRTLTIRLDQIWAAGVGFSRRFDDSRLDVNFNVYHLGDAPVDTGFDSPARGRVVGDSDNPYAISLDCSWHW